MINAEIQRDGPLSQKWFPNREWTPIAFIIIFLKHYQYDRLQKIYEMLSIFHLDDMHNTHLSLQ